MSLQSIIFIAVLILVCFQYGSAVGNRRPLPAYSRKHVLGKSEDDKIIGTADINVNNRMHDSEKANDLHTFSKRDALLNSDLNRPFVNNFQHNTISEKPTLAHPLLMRTSTVYVCFLFGLLIWRSFSAYEMAGQFTSQSLQLLTTVPVIGILLANIVGLVVNLIQPLNFKNHLKAILAVNILREWLEMAYNIFMMLFASSSSALPRTEYLGRLFMNIWWNSICFSCIKSRWVLSESTTPNMRAGGQ